MDAPASLVSVRGLVKRYGGVTAVDGVSLDVRRGEIFGLLGPDGAGKSSIMKSIAGVLSFDSGEIDVLGVRVDSERAAERIKPRVGFLPQGLGLSLYPELSVEENIDFFAGLRRVGSSDLAARKERLLRITRLAAFRDRPMKQLSGGMKQKLGLVATLIHEPELLILDEPTTGVDPVSRHDFWEILYELVRQHGMTTLVSTTYDDEARKLDRVAVIDGGRVVSTEIPEPQPITRAAQRVSIDTPVIVEASHLTRDFAKFRAADDVSFAIRAGEIFGLLGANGAGKTTVIKMLTGLLSPTGGTARIEGIDMRRAGRDVRNRMGYVSQLYSLYRDLTVMENIRLSGGIYGLTRAEVEERAAWVIEMAGLEGQEDAISGDLPIGLRQRLALGCALVHRPRVLLLDEPTSGVDAAGRRKFWDILGRLARDEGVAILVSTHSMAEAEECDRIALMHDGRVIACDTPATLEREAASRGLPEPVTMEDVFVELVRSREALSDLAAIHQPRPFSPAAAGEKVPKADEADAPCELGAESRELRIPTRIEVLITKEWRELVRDPLFLALALVVPVTLMLLFGYGITLDLDNVPLAIVDYDHSSASREYSDLFVHSRWFDFRGYGSDERPLLDLLERNELRAIVVIPEHFGRTISRGGAAHVQTLIDGTYPFRAQTTSAYISGITAAFARDVVIRQLERAGIPDAGMRATPLRLEARYLYNQSVRSSWSIAPKLIMVILMISPPFLTALGIVREKERGSIYNIYVSPVGRAELLIGKAAIYTGVSLLNATILTAIVLFVFHAPFKGSGAIFIAATIVYVICTTMFGLLVSALVKTQVAAMVATAVVTVIPAILYSGVLAPIPSLSPAAQIVAHSMPTMYYADIIANQFLKGVPGAAVRDFAVLIAYSLGLFAAAWSLFTKRPAR